MLDFAPKSPRGDDMVYERNPKVWKKVPRGCAILNLVGPKGEKKVMWAVRANRKFTGHEDEGTSNASLYTIWGPKADTILVTLKENGQVCHVAARTVSLDLSTGGTAETLLLFFGSKKVHLTIPYNESPAKMQASLDTFSMDRHRLVNRMARIVLPYLNKERLLFLAQHRLVVNSEVILPSSTGPAFSRYNYYCCELVHAFSSYLKGLIPLLSSVPSVFHVGLRLVLWSFFFVHFSFSTFL